MNVLKRAGFIAAVFLAAVVGAHVGAVGPDAAYAQFAGDVFHVFGSIEVHDPDQAYDPTATAVFTIDGDGGGVLTVDGALSIGTQNTIADSDETPDVSGGSYFITGDATDTITDFDGTGIVAGQVIFVESDAAITYDVTSSGLVCGDTDIVTADGDSTGWFYDGTDWHCFFFQDLTDNANTWGAA